MLKFSEIIGFPSDNVPREQKESLSFISQVGQAIYSRWYNGRTLFGHSATGWFQMMTDYAESRQSSAPYRDWFLGTKNDKNSTDRNFTEYSRKAYTNVSYEIVSPAPKFISTIKSMLSASDFKVHVESLNQEASYQKAYEKWKLYYDDKLINPLREQIGIPTKDYPWVPANETELDMYERYHGFKLPLEMAMADIAEHVFQISDWDKIRLRTIEKLIETNFCVGRVYTDDDGSTKMKFINPAAFVTAYIDESEEAEPAFAGHIERVQIKDIKHKLLNLGASPQDLEQLARIYYETQGYSDKDFNFNRKDPVTGRYIWEDFVVEVLHFEYKSNDYDYFTGREKKDGTYVYAPEEYGVIKKPYADGRKRKTDVTCVQNLYTGNYILGTRFVYDYGMQKNMMRDSKGNVALSYFFERVPGKAIVERWKPHLDSLMLTWIKLQAAKWSAAPKGLMIDIGLLSNMDMGFGKMTPLELIRIRRQTGNQFIQSKTDILNKGGGASSIQELPGGIGPQLQEWLTCWQDDMNRIMDLAGITPAMAAQPTNNSEQGLGLAQMEVDSTNHAMYPLKKALMRFKEKAARKAILMTRTNIKFDKEVEKYYSNLLGKEKMNALNSFEDLTLDQIGITLVSTPSAQRKQIIMQAALESMKVGKSGQPGITMGDYLFIEKELEKGNDEFASWYLTLSEERSKREIQGQKEKMMQMNAQAQQQSAMMAQQAKAQADMAVQQLKTDQMLTEYQQKALLEQVKHNHRMAELAQEGTLEKQKEVEISGNL
jgi:hypothetical protein